MARPHPDLELVVNARTVADGVTLLSVLRDEALRLPYFLEYYRALGVGHFVVVDNGSTDGSAELLAGQPDVTLYRTSASFAAARSGLVWITALSRHHAMGRWCLLADPDELLVYPDSETTGLDVLTRCLDACGWDLLPSAVIDMYADLPITEVRYTAGTPFFAACPFHDAAYHVLPHHPFPGLSRRSPDFQIIGGPRTRLMYPEKMRASMLYHFAVRAFAFAHKRTLQRWTGQTLVRRTPSPFNFKCGLFRCRPDSWHLSPHFMVRRNPAPFWGATLHFKYFQDFCARVAKAIAEKQHSNGANEYRRYAEFLEANPAFSLMAPDSVRYGGSLSLGATVPLCADHPAWQSFRAKG